MTTINQDHFNVLIKRLSQCNSEFLFGKFNVKGINTDITIFTLPISIIINDAFENFQNEPWCCITFLPWN